MANFYADFDLTTGLNDGSSSANAFQTLQDVLDAIVATTIVGGDVVLSTGTDTLLAVPSAGVIIDPINPVIFRGVNSSFVNDGTRAVVDCNSAVAGALRSTGSGIQGFEFENFTFQNSTGNFIDETAGSITFIGFKNCKFLNCGGYVFDAIDNFNVIDCYFSGTVSGDFFACSRFNVLRCFFIGGSGYVTFQSNRYTMSDFIVHDYFIGTDITSTFASVTNGVIDTCSSRGCFIRNQNFHISNIRITNTATAIDASVNVDGSSYSNTYFYNPTGTDIGGADSGNLRDYGYNRLTGVNSGDGYNSVAGHDFRLTVGDDGVGVSIPIGGADESTNIFGLTQGIPPTYPITLTVTDIAPAEGGVGSSVVITGTNFSASGNIVKLGGSGGTSATVTAESTTEITFTVPSYALGDVDIYIENATGDNILVPNGFKVISTAVPVFSGITHFEILSNNKFYVKCGTATNGPDYLNIYIATSTNPFAGAYSFKVPYSANKEILVTLASDHLSPLVGGTVYYCGLRAENSVGEDTNTAELSNICSGAETIQRMNIVTPVISL